MTILIAPDKFKSSLTAEQVCFAIHDGLKEAGLRFTSSMIPMADGGEGTCDMLTNFSGGKKISVKISDPFFREIDGQYGLSGDGKTAYIEMASASGLQLLKPEERNPLKATTYGTGQLIADALNRGVERIIMGIGGSATNDAGIGMAEALGVKFYSIQNKLLRPVGENLIHIHTIDKTNLHPRLREVSFIALCDVNNPFYGTRGAAYVFAQQKGADQSAVKFLDDGLRNYAAVVEKQFGVDINFPGAGAGGGLSGGAKVFFNIDFKPGIDFLIGYVNLEKKIQQSDVVITGEGKIDEQTLSGKVVKGIADLCVKNKKTLYVVAGKNELNEEQMNELGIHRIISLLRENVTMEQAMLEAFALLKKNVTEEIGRELCEW